MSDYECHYCKKQYREKYKHDRHILICEFFYKSQREIKDIAENIEEKIPSTRELYLIMQDMMFRIKKLEDENKKLKQIQNKKINILEWLNTSTKPKLTLARWINEHIIPNVNKYLETVFEENLVTGITKLIEEAISLFDIEELPLRTFENKPNVFFIYKKEDDKHIWLQISSTVFDKYITVISQQFVIDFNNKWYLENKSKIDSDETYKDMYVTRYKNIIGGNTSEEQNNKRIREYIFKQLLTNIKTIVEYDIV